MLLHLLFTQDLCLWKEACYCAHRHSHSARVGRHLVEGREGMGVRGGGGALQFFIYNRVPRYSGILQLAVVYPVYMENKSRGRNGSV